jgi:hypothetical protein
LFDFAASEIADSYAEFMLLDDVFKLLSVFSAVSLICSTNFFTLDLSLAI